LIQLHVPDLYGNSDSEKLILQHLFFPTEWWDSSMSLNNHDEWNSPGLQSPSEQWISKYWDESHGFILPMKTKKGGVRFTTRDIVSPAYFDIYNKSYLQPACISHDYLLKMYDRSDIQKEMEEYLKLKVLMEQSDHFKNV
jgi:hypothetical protein